jgi:hypothetical protein
LPWFTKDETALGSELQMEMQQLPTKAGRLENGLLNPISYSNAYYGTILTVLYSSRTTGMQLVDADLSIDEFCGKLENMTKSLVDTRQVIKNLLER